MLFDLGVSSPQLDQRLQPAPVTAQLDDVLHAAYDDIRVKGLGNDIRRAQLKYPDLAAGAVVRGDDDGRDMIEQLIEPHLFEHLVSVLFRHNQVQQNHRDGFAVLTQEHQRLLPVFGLQQIVLRFKQVPQHGTVDL